jgi:catechol 2,3-dioxygenase-like lactoylglutathione lyase family enzyme
MARMPDMRLGETIPALPVGDAAVAAAFYRERLGFDVPHISDDFAVVRRDDATLHLWQADDETWTTRPTIERPVRSGAESFIAGTASCRIRVDDLDAL